MQPGRLALEIGQGEVFQYRHLRAGAHGRVLIHAADLARAHMLTVLADIAPLHEDLPAVRLDAAADQVEQARFA